MHSVASNGSMLPMFRVCAAQIFTLPSYKRVGVSLKRCYLRLTFVLNTRSRLALSFSFKLASLAVFQWKYGIILSVDASSISKIS